MRPTFYEIKKASRNALRTRWPEAVLVVLAFCIISLVNSISQALLMHLFRLGALWSPFSDNSLPALNLIASISITLLSALFSFIVSLPFVLGVLKWFWAVTNGSNARLSDVFFYFQSGSLYRKAVTFSIFIFLRIALMSIVCFLPYILAKILTNPAFYLLLGKETPIFVSGLFNMVDILKGLGIVSVAVLNMKHLLFPFLLFTNPELSSAKTIKKAREIYHFEPLKLISFVFSFFGWFLLCIFVIPIVFVAPYFISSLAIYAREENREHERRQGI